MAKSKIQSVEIEKEYLSVPELSIHSGMSERTLWDLIRSKSDPIPHYRFGRLVKVRRCDFDAWAEMHKVDTNLVDRIVDEVFQQ